MATSFSVGKMNLAELPEDCIASIISHTSPLDATRLAGVCSTFRRASQFDTVWQNFLPCDYKSVCRSGQENQNKREIVMSLTEGVLLENGMQKYTLLRCSGGVCRKLSVAGMDVAWGQDSRFWKWDHSRSSCFGKVAHLLAVCWLEITGLWSCSLPPGSYTVAWRLRVANPQGGRRFFLSWKCPLTFSITTADSQVLEKKLNLSQVPGNGFEQWFEFEVGDIRVLGEKHSVKQIELQYSIREMDCTYWKGGLFVDCLTLRPTGCSEEAQPIKLDQQLSKIRGRPGVF